MKITIREFEHEQIPNILRLCRNPDIMPLDSYRYHPFTEQDFDRAILQQGPFGETFDPSGFFLAFVYNELVGFIRTYVIKLGNEMIGFVSPEWPWSPLSLVVHPKHRRKGVGTALLNRSLEYLVERNVGAAQTSTDEKCIPRLRFLTKNGFEVWGKPHFIMESNLNRNISEPTLPDGYSFEEFSLGDEEELVSACNKFFGESAKPRPVAGFVNYYEKHPNFDPGGFLSTVYRGEIVGTVWNIISESYLNHSKRRTGFLEVLGVAREHRRKGLGKALVLKSLIWHKRKGMENVSVMTDSDIAFKLYVKCGFKVTSTWKILRKPI